MQIPNLQPPNSGKVTQFNNSNILGDLWASFNIDLSENEGAFRIGKRLYINTSTADVTEITGYPVGFAVLGSTKFTVAGASGTGYAFSNASNYPSAGTFAKITAANSPSACDCTYSDLIVSNDNLYVTTASNSVHQYNGNTSAWSTFTAGASDSSSAHMLTSYGGRTYMTRAGSSIISWDSVPTVATSGQYTLTLTNTDSNIITFMRAASNRIWIGTVNTLGGKGYIYEWDGSLTQPTKSYRLESSGALSCVVMNDVPYVIDTNGALLAWNGGTFKKLTQLNRRRNRLLWNPLSRKNDRFIHPNGMSVINGKIHIFIDGRNNDGSSTAATQEETIPSGVYEYDENKGLVHKYSVGYTKSGSTIIDYGASRIAGAGGLSEFNQPNTTSGRNGTLLLGASYYTDASTSASAIFYDDSLDTGRKAGYFITTKQRPRASKLGPVLAGTWSKLYISFREFLNANSRIVIKGRTSEQEPSTHFTVSWPNSTQFNTSADLSSWAVGDEVEIVAGEAAGYLAHITAMAGPVGGVTTVTVDTTMPVSGLNTSVARLQKWVKLKEITDQSKTWEQFGVGQMTASNWAQFKVWMVATGQDEIECLFSADSANQIGQ